MISPQDYKTYLQTQVISFGGTDNFHRENFYKSWVTAPPESNVLDLGCGDGHGIVMLAERGFKEVVGLELSPVKWQRACEQACAVLGDMHSLWLFPDQSFDAVVSSHSLEHCFDPFLALSEMRRVLKDSGTIFLALPFPDLANETAHCASEVLGLKKAQGDVVATFEEHGFAVTEIHLEHSPEKEIWLKLRKAI